MALSVVRGAATFLVAIGATTDIDRHGRWIARSRLTHNVTSPLLIDALQQVQARLMLGAPGQLPSLAGQEHGRTIALAATCQPRSPRVSACSGLRVMSATLSAVARHLGLES